MDREDGRTIPRAALEERRRVVVRMWQANATVSEIVAATGACYASVYSIWRQFKAEGKKAIRVRPKGHKHGDGRHLSQNQELHIQKQIIDKHPEQLKLDFALWTRGAVRLLIKQECGFDMPIRTVGEYLKRWGFTPQKPVKFAYERNSEKVRAWLVDTYPGISGRAKAEGADIYWGDETGLRASDVRGRGFSLRGKTPVVQATAAYQNLSMVSAITNKGKVSWMIVDGSVNVERFIVFLERLLQDAGRKVFLILDNLKVHHGILVQEWVKQQKGRIELFYLPAYSPDLNPDEHVNADLKYGIGSRVPVRTKAKLKQAADEHMAMLKATPARIEKYFEDPAISYAAV
jgi:transposase